jgi:leader peptidase (prepilin peptidase)/N-methyltransferase
MDFIELLRTSTPFLLVTAGLFGLAVGSFLNVVIHRLPIMMQREWRQQCAELGHVEGLEDKPAEEGPFNLLHPRSRCPHCGHAISALENIPVISYLWLKGRCAGCGAGISPRYPIIELATAILSVLVAWHFGATWQTLAGLFFTWALIALTMIDFDHQLLPDSITLPFLWIGLTLSLFNIYIDSHSAIIGALAGYLSLWSVYWLFKKLTGKEGMGFGDFKLLAMLGAWMGWQLLPAIILLSSMVGAVIGISLILIKGRDKNIPIPFGPYLAAAGWIALLWGQDLTGLYLRFSGIQ